MGFRRSKQYQRRLHDKLAHHTDHGTHHKPYNPVPQEIQESAKVTTHWLNYIQHQQGVTDISEELRKNQHLHHKRRATKYTLRKQKRIGKRIRRRQRNVATHAKLSTTRQKLRKPASVSESTIIQSPTKSKIHQSYEYELHPHGEPYYNVQHHGETNLQNADNHYKTILNHGETNLQHSDNHHKTILNPDYHQQQERNEIDHYDDIKVEGKGKKQMS